MDSRLLQALLYFLPGNLYQSPDNPLQPDRLPDISGVELDYPVYQDRPAAAAKYFAIIVFCSSLTAPVLAWTVQLISIPFLFGGLYTVGLLLGGGLIVLGIFGRWWPLASFAVAITALPVLVLLARDVPFVLVALLLVVVAQIYFADLLVTSFLYFKTAAPLSREQSQRARSLWHRRFVNFREPLRGSELYFLGFLAILPAAWFVVNAVAAGIGRLEFEDNVKLFAILSGIGIGWCLISELVLAPLFGRTPYSPLKCASALLRALVIWSTYNRSYARGAGVHQSPAGNCATRRHLLIGLIASWGCIWAGLQMTVAKHPLQQLFEGLQAQSLFPSTVTPKDQATDTLGSKLNPTFWFPPPPAWADPDAPESLHQSGSSYDSLPPEYKRPVTKDPERSDTEVPKVDHTDAMIAVASELEPIEREFVNRLSPAQAAEYLKKRVELRAAEIDQAELERRQAAANDGPKNLLLSFFYQLAKVLIHVLVPSLGVLIAAGSLLLAMVGRSLAGIEDSLGNAPPERVFKTENWENLVRRVRLSEDKFEKESVLMGVNARDDTPVLVPRNVFGEHAHVLGDSGSGKTSLGLVPLITQLIRFGDCSVVVIDLKADDQFFMETLKRESALLDKKKREDKEPSTYPFRWFSTVLGRSSFGFNPLTQPVMAKLHPDQRTDFLTAAMGLQYGNDYGRKYYADANYAVLNFALRENPNVRSFAELEQILAGAERFPLPSELKKAATHIRSYVHRLARCEALNVCPEQRTPKCVLDNAIDLDQLFSHPQALYVALPPWAGISATAEVARIFLYALLASAQGHEGPRKPVVLVIDEFQRIVSKNVELFLQQARSMNIGCILSNQSLADLDSVDADLIPAVRTNTRFRQVFGAGSKADLDDLIDSSGESVYATRNWQFALGIFQPELRGVSVNETRGTRLSINDILLATDAPGRNIACVRRGAGYAQFGGMPFLMDSAYHIDKDAYDKLSTEKWPAADERMIVAKLPPPGVVTSVGGGQILGEMPPEDQAGPTTEAVQEATTENAAEQLAPDETNGEGVSDELIEVLFKEQEAEREAIRARIKRAKARSSSPRNRP